MVQAHIFAHGRVQGVNFRYYTRQRAFELGVTGWVRNVRDGRVEAVFQGDKDQVAKVLNWCESGPPSAYVENVEIEWEEASESFTGFEIRFWGG